MEQEVAEVADDVALSETEAREAIQEAYDRVANPNQEPKTQEPKTPEPQAPTAEKPPAPHTDDIEALRLQVARIPELEKMLRDEGGRYGALKQTIEQLQQRITAPATAQDGEAAQEDLDEALKDIKEAFGEDSDLYMSLRKAFSKVSRGGKAADPEELQKMVGEGVEARLKAKADEDLKKAQEVLAQDHPDWDTVRDTPEYKNWLDSLTARSRKRFLDSSDPLYVAERLDEFKEWRTERAESKSETPPSADEKPSPKPQPSKRLQAAVLPTSGNRPSAPLGEDKSAQVRAAYERVAGNRR